MKYSPITLVQINSKNEQNRHMQVLVLKTNLKSKAEVEKIKPIFNLHPSINNWNVDSDDIDNVLRIESQHELKEFKVISLLNQYGIQGESLN